MHIDAHTPKRVHVNNQTAKHHSTSHVNKGIETNKKIQFRYRYGEKKNFLLKKNRERRHIKKKMCGNVKLHVHHKIPTIMIIPQAFEYSFQ